MSYLEELLPEFRKGAKIRLPLWEKGQYFCIKDGKVIDENGVYHNEFYDGYLTSDEWEFYKEPEPDWGYIIKNKCLCWFWDGSGKYKQLGILINVNEHNTLCRYDCRKSTGEVYLYANCRPVRRDEVTFYEDKEDE